MTLDLDELSTEEVVELTKALKKETQKELIAKDLQGLGVGMRLLGAFRSIATFRRMRVHFALF